MDSILFFLTAMLTIRVGDSIFRIILEKLTQNNFSYFYYTIANIESIIFSLCILYVFIHLRIIYESNVLILIILLFIQGAYSTIRNSYFYQNFETTINAITERNFYNSLNHRIFIYRQKLLKLTLTLLTFFFIIIIIEKYFTKDNNLINFVENLYLTSNIENFYKLLVEYKVHYFMSILSIINFFIINKKAEQDNNLQQVINRIVK
jgi:hypothetical protein